MRTPKTSLRGKPLGERLAGALRSLQRSRLTARLLSSARGAGLLELALTIPVLVVGLLTAGLWRYCSVATLKQEMTAAARVGAQVSLSRPSPARTARAAACSAQTPAPCNVVAAVRALTTYMGQKGVDLSCVDPASPSIPGPDPREYTYTCSSIPALRIVIDPGAAPAGYGSVHTSAVSFAYPLPWWLSKFGPWPSAPVATLHASVRVAASPAKGGGTRL